MILPHDITPARKEVGYEPEAPASAWLVPAGIHSLAPRARMSLFSAGGNIRSLGAFSKKSRTNPAAARHDIGEKAAAGEGCDR